MTVKRLLALLAAAAAAVLAATAIAKRRQPVHTPPEDPGTWDLEDDPAASPAAGP